MAPYRVWDMLDSEWTLCLQICCVGSTNWNQKDTRNFGSGQTLIVRWLCHSVPSVFSTNWPSGIVNQWRGHGWSRLCGPIQLENYRSLDRKENECWVWWKGIRAQRASQFVPWGCVAINQSLSPWWPLVKNLKPWSNERKWQTVFTWSSNSLNLHPI